MVISSRLTLPSEMLRESNAEAYANRADAAELDVVYRFGEALVDEDKVEITKEGISIPGYAQEVAFDLENPFSDM